MDKDQLLFHRLKEYADSETYPLHMPGHKRRFYEGTDAYGIDITEIDGFDNLHHPEGILRKSMSWAASVYGSDQTYYLVNGSSCGILSAVCAAVHSGGTLLMSRNCHKSAYHAAILGQLKTTYIYPQIVETLGIQGGILSEEVEHQLNETKNIQAVLIVSPTYDGIVSDIQKIAEVVHRRRIPLLVDEAHGAHFPFSGRIRSALDCGADVVIQSLHKTLPSLTQTAVLHVRQGLVDVARLERFLQIYQSSSPSYILMASAEQCVYEMEMHGSEHMRCLYNRIRILRERLKNLHALRILDASAAGKDGVFAVDETKLLISVRDCFLADGSSADGLWLTGILRERYHLETEMAGADYALAIMTCMDEEEGFLRLEKAILDADSLLQRKCREKEEEKDGRTSAAENGEIWSKTAFSFPDVRMTLAAAFDAPWEELPFRACTGRVSSEFIYVYPPGIPVLAPGEIVTEAVICQIEEYRRRGYPVQGTADARAEKLRVVLEKKKNQGKTDYGKVILSDGKKRLGKRYDL